jgi:hypothetical protein
LASWSISNTRITTSQLLQGNFAVLFIDQSGLV